MRDTNLSGRWSGEFSYPANAGPVTPFLATIEDTDGRLFGEIIEPDIVNETSTAHATLSGLRHGFTVDFTKSYGPLAPYGYENPVDYVGSISSNGNVVRGVWSMLELDGTFEMRREAVEHEGKQAEEEIALSVPVTS